MTEEVGLQGGWFVAKVLMKTEKEAFVQYNELFRDDGTALAFLHREQTK